MTNLAATLKKEIARVARKELREDISSLRKNSATYRSEIAELKRKIKAMESQLRSLGRMQKNAAPKKAPADDPPTRRRAGTFDAAALLAQRKHLGITQGQMAELLGASSLSVYKWESGQVAPRAAQVERILAVMKLGKRAALAHARPGHPHQRAGQRRRRCRSGSVASHHPGHRTRRTRGAGRARTGGARRRPA